jgi:hypothetical protein
MALEQVKRQGAMEALRLRIRGCLWNARVDSEKAGETNGPKYVAFNEKVASARRNLLLAEQAYDELRRIEKKR